MVQILDGFCGWRLPKGEYSNLHPPHHCKYTPSSSISISLYERISLDSHSVGPFSPTASLVPLWSLQTSHGIHTNPRADSVNDMELSHESINHGGSQVDPCSFSYVNLVAFVKGSAPLMLAQIRPDITECTDLQPASRHLRAMHSG